MSAAEVDLIAERARRAEVDPCVYGIHLLSRVSILNYIRIADEVKRFMPGGSILDWGCSYGQMSFLLQRRGLEVIGYDLGGESKAAPSPLFPEVTITRGNDPVRIPYPDSTFDAVLSCGVLEHVENESGSLKEINRILRPRGHFFLYNLPQQGSYKEFMLSRLHVGYTHERKYTMSQIQAVLEGNNFRVVMARRSSMLPQNLSPLPQFRGIFNHLAPAIWRADRLLSGIPVVNRVAEALELVAVKRLPV